MGHRYNYTHHDVQSPCMTCESRAAGCHDDCLRYAEYRKVMDEHAKLIRKRKEGSTKEIWRNSKG